MAGQKKIWQNPRAKMLGCFPFKVCIYQENKLKASKIFCAKQAKLKAFAGHIWPAGRMLCMPGLLQHPNLRVKIRPELKIIFNSDPYAKNSGSPGMYK